MRGMLYVRLQAWQVGSDTPLGLGLCWRPRGCSPRDPSLQRLPPTPIVRLMPNRRHCRPSGCPGGSRVVFRRDSKVDAFQRQISALRHQVGGENEDDAVLDRDRPRSISNEHSFLSEYPELASIRSDRTSSSHGITDPLGSRPPDPTPPAIPAIDMETSVIAHSTAWSGDLELSGWLHISGRVEGTLTARDSIFIAEEPDVEAVIRAASVTVA